MSANKPDTEQIVTVIGVGLVLLGGAAAGMGTYAYFTETDTSSANTVSGGTLDLTLDGTNGDVTSSFSLAKGAPGTTVTHTYDLRNVGPVSADHVEVTLSATENDGGMTEPSDADLNTELNNTQTQQQIRVVKYEYQNDAGTVLTDMRSSISDTNNNGIKDLAEAIDQTGITDGLAPPQANSGNTTKLVITLEIASESGSFTGSDEAIMADGVDVKLAVTLNQDSSQ